MKVVTYILYTFLRTPIVHRMWEKSQRDMEADLAHECHGFYRVGISSILLFEKKMATYFWKYVEK